MKEDKKKERVQGLYVKWNKGKETKNMKLTEEIFSRGPEPLSCVSTSGRPKMTMAVRKWDLVLPIENVVL